VPPGLFLIAGRLQPSGALNARRVLAGDAAVGQWPVRPSGRAASDRASSLVAARRNLGHRGPRTAQDGGCEYPQRMVLTGLIQRYKIGAWMLNDYSPRAIRYSP
jgi:hypothetical protein